ncbi:hypothetical protein MesoLj131c_63750 [Mesorhizobium sp. 131-3-5]|uniref:type II toxin-antitoxin system HicB family antitoxin n=1 Tax=Mesorhizobium sp. 131-3-5 TaxID=2744520 RepID=UPI0019354CB3|nr:hypothetical protein MesoLj131c_63750 [Mesorhizobium sp. 131-3-5]
MDYPIIIAPLGEEDGGGYLGFAPDLLGCMSDGETHEETLANTKEAIAEWIETAERRGMEIPAPGSAASRERSEKEHLVSALKDLAGSVDHIENRIQELERVVRDMEDRFHHEDAWARFADITSLPVTRQTKHSVC